MILSVVVLFIIIQSSLFCYIDPGTGSLLFSALFGIIGTLFFLSKVLLIKLKTFSFADKINKKENISKAKIIIYGEDKRYYNVFKPIIEELINLEIPTIYYSSSYDDKIFEIKSDFLKSEFIGTGNKAYAKLNFIEADICLMTTPNLDVFQLKRSKGVKKYVHITHSSAETSTYCLYSLDFFDAVFLNGEHQIRDIRELEKKRNTTVKDLYVVGNPYLDELSKMKESLTKENNSKKTILIAPSWGMNCLFRRFGEKLLDNIVNSDYNIIIRPHPQSLISDKDIIDKFQNRYKYKNNVEWDFNRVNIYSLSKADIMISDFSGVIFDYAFLFEKPVIIPSFTFDKRGTDAIEIDEEVWTFETIPKISFKLDENNFSNISQIIEDSINNETLKNNILKAKEEAYMYEGQASKRAAQFLNDMLITINN
ncbi:CDP-glycerol--glycerophosphate glycerophosphotransferase [Brachyspira aalborgi]|uniref:CDP-glycerol--glycerophosphate glycerophosphotransferase n=1 Tax=Brachyspira aalborgi TaxID=29522 RepID=A0A5C8EWU2_9SPIR|nr:CDP-glycerol glycerophosphotransferase family protein [Brachyspira aalborgi]TXJ41544.1 CDP-glycerol--glycerophosphate glycerophosphotransferase [Brachyspira aalborgi]TXJ54356.1 CDP-glycerol--glycerophosphate glycerophosphotransferase [Brachyspira aalborgi]